MILAYKNMHGLTIVQTMLILLVVGIAGSLLVNYIIDKRCEAEPALKMCVNRQ